jgi:hypothetical protein
MVFYMKIILMDFSKCLVVALVILFFNSSFSKSPEADTVINNHKYIDLTIYLEKDFIKTYGEDRANDIRYEDLLFSPDGQFLAINISDIITGDPEQVWIMDLKTKKCRLVTALAENDNHVRVGYLKWDSQRILRICVADRYVEKVLLASIENTTEIKDICPENYTQPRNNNKPSSKYYKIDWSPETLHVINIQTGKIHYMKGRYATQTLPSLQWTYDEKHFVSLMDFERNYSSLLIGYTSPLFRVESPISSNGRLEYDISPYSPEIVYTLEYDSCFAIYDYLKHKTVQKIKTGIYPENISWSKNKLIAFVSREIGGKKHNLIKRLYLVEL